MQGRPRRRPGRLRWLCLALPALIPVVLAGCGGVSISPNASASLGDTLSIYSSMPLQGPSALISTQIVGGEKLALAQAGGHVGRFEISYHSLDDSRTGSEAGQWSSDQVSTDAKEAAEETNTVAYIGDYDSGATAVSLPITNAAGILQVSPASPYVGLTESRDANQDEPGRFYPAARRNFARLLPADPVQAEAQTRLMQSLGVGRVYVLNDEDSFEVPLSELVAEEAKKAGLEVLADEGISTSGQSFTAETFSSEAQKIAASGAQAVFYAGGTGPGAVALWEALHEADPTLDLLASSAADEVSFTSQIGPAAAAQTYITTPLFPDRMYPAAAQKVFAAYRKRFGEEPEPYVLYGYEAMSAVLAAIAAAGPRGDSREAVLKSFFEIRDRHSVLGEYSVRPDGDTTLTRYAVDRVRHGKPVFYRSLRLPPSGP